MSILSICREKQNAKVSRQKKKWIKDESLSHLERLHSSGAGGKKKKKKSKSEIELGPHDSLSSTKQRELWQPHSPLLGGIKAITSNACGSSGLAHGDTTTWFVF